MDPRTAFDGKISNVFKSAAFSRPLDLKKTSRLVRAAYYQESQARRRSRAAATGKTVPAVLIASVTRKCNLDCVGCYAKALRPQGEVAAELSDDRFMELFEEALELGTGVLMLAGGEPLLRRSLLERAALLKGPLIPVFTNGLLVDEGWMDLFGRGSLVPVFSIEGDASHTSQRRGSGIHERVLKSMEALKARGALFGVSVTATSGNADTILSSPFLKNLEEMGASVLFIVEYVPAAPGTDGLVLTDSQKSVLLSKEPFRNLRYPVVALPGDEEAFGGCLAAGRGFIHLSPEGALEACPFAPFSDTSAADRCLSDALNSPLLAAIRERHAELTETKGGCALWNKRGWVASLSACAAIAS
ncbi:MAG: radical SAM protein [Spirochaetales bacterium]|nr:MAG: radical SAM protein [Spirochaetales bacterium]